MKTILAGVDFSDVTDAVLGMVSDLARATGARVYLLHVAAPDPDFVGYEVGPQTVRDSRAKEVRGEHQQLERMKKRLCESGVSAESLLLQGPAVEKMLQEADRVGADVLIIGSHGHGAIRRLLVGSVAEGVLHRTSRPVLIVPAAPKK
jgi:nucleotide-binding universal stress UspA family protein